jgi:hypothetical protein
MPPDVLVTKIAEMPPSWTTPRKRSSSVSPVIVLLAGANGPTVPSEAPRASNASKLTAPPPSVHTIPAWRGRPPSAFASNSSRSPARPLPENSECPPTPLPSITPSSASTESVIELGFRTEPE